MVDPPILKGLVIAAGRGLRMGELTDALPKCLLQFGDQTLLEHAVDNLRAVGSSEIVIIVGYKAHMINVPGVRYLTNHDFASNNILHSLMVARGHLVGDVIVSYSDIWVEPWVHDRLVQTPGDIVLAVDQDWQPYYEGRTEHPESQAEKVYFDRKGTVVRIGKHLDANAPGELICGEFIGLWRMSSRGSTWFCTEFAAIDARITPDAQFQGSQAWKNAYVTDLIQELVDRGHPVKCALIERGWAEFDTRQDYTRLPDVAQSQRLASIVGLRTNDE